MKSSLSVRATLVADEFIDRYMPGANGEYVKVYLYLLRHQERNVTEVELADVLNHTESDIRRAMAYWEKLGVLVKGCDESESKIEEETLEAADSVEPEPVTIPSSVKSKEPAEAPLAEKQQEKPAVERSAVADTRIPTQRQLYTPEQVKQLGDDDDFTQLLYIAQKYMNKVFTPRECEVFAYLYDGLNLSAELLEYLVEYCVQGGHYSIRYLETVALNWHEKGIHTVERARQHTASFSNEAFAVMKAFGLNDRRPGDTEMSMIRKWFQDWGFTREMVLEACGRTLRATQKPSFAYADRILSEWKKDGVRVMADVRKTDQARENSRPKAVGQVNGTSGTKNKFHNFEQRDTNYDAIVMERLKERLGEQ